MANKYNNGKIYILTSKQTNKVYIGSTTKGLNERFDKHIGHLTHFNKEEGNFHYITSFELIQHDDCEISLLEAVNVKTKKELHQYEAKHIKSNNNCVNKVIPGQTDREYYLAHRDKILAYAKKYAQEHPEATKRNAERFRKKHKEKINAKQKEVLDCPCGDTFTRSNKLYHYDTPKHKKFLETGVIEDKIIIPLTQMIICPCGSDHTYANHLRHATTDVHKRYEAKKAIADANGVELTMEDIKAPPKCDCDYIKYPITHKRHTTSKQHIIFMKNKAIIEAGGVIEDEDDPLDENGKKIKPKIVCPCGGEYFSRNTSKHLDTLIHKNYVKNNKIDKIPIVEDDIDAKLKEKLQLVKKSIEKKQEANKNQIKDTDSIENSLINNIKIYELAIVDDDINTKLKESLQLVKKSMGKTEKIKETQTLAEDTEVNNIEEIQPIIEKPRRKPQKIVKKQKNNHFIYKKIQ